MDSNVCDVSVKGGRIVPSFPGRGNEELTGCILHVVTNFLNRGVPEDATAYVNQLHVFIREIIFHTSTDE